MSEFIHLVSPTQEFWLRLEDIAYVETLGIAGKPTGWLEYYPAIVTLKDGVRKTGENEHPLAIQLNTAQWWQLRQLLEFGK